MAEKIDFKLVLHLGAAQTLYYSSLYYLYPAMMQYILQDRSWSALQYNAAFSIVMLVSGLCAPFFGRLVDRSHSRRLLAVCGLLGGAALLAVPTTRNLPMFYLLSVLVGVASAMGQYEVCFSYLVRLYPKRSSYPIILVTLMAGFASSITFPFAYHAAATIGWRAGIMILGVLSIVMGASFWPESASGKEGQRSSAATESAASQVAGKSSVQLHLIVVLILVTLSRALAMMAIKTVHTQILPLMQSIAVSSAFGLLLASSIGPMQVAGRLMLFFWARIRPVAPLRFSAVTLLSLVSAAVFLLGAFSAPLAAVPFVVLHGMAIGLLSVLNPLVLARLFGVERIGHYVGVSALFAKVAAAAAPIVSSAFLTTGGMYSVPIALLTLNTGALFSFLLAIGYHHRSSNKMRTMHGTIA